MRYFRSSISACNHELEVGKFSIDVKARSEIATQVVWHDEDGAEVTNEEKLAWLNAKFEEYALLHSI